ncbi:PREDICTED: zinc finger protein rotund-like [Camelina sativa]|uniref:Zinc finger protein rotund-like n=1 Tax=Camelina sativa TaxID=90675 RepID=A0ABM0T1S7_CAMSA|nr:PREDICTED: zinc finger protein rotund-like [Camelina sativa]
MSMIIIQSKNNKRGDLLAPNGVISHQEMHMSSMPDSPMMEAAGSSIGSSSSSPSTSNLPPIRVRVSEDQRIEEQLAQMTFSNMQTQRQFDDGISLMTNRPMMVPSGAMTDASMAYNNAPSDSSAPPSNGQVSPHDDRSDSGVSAGYRKPPLPMQPVTIPPRTTGGYALTSPDSVASDTSISSATSFSKPMYYQDQPPALPKAPPVTQPETTSVQSSHVLPQTETTSPLTTSHIQSQPGTYTTMDQQQHQPTVQQPYLHQGVQYIPHASQYFPVYSHQQQNYPVYVMSVPQSQQYVPAGTPPLYPISKPATNSRPEAAQNVYRASPPHVLQLQQQHQYMGYTGVPQHTTNANANYSTGVPPQHATNANANYSIGAPQHSSNTNYGGAYEYTNPPNETVYYHAQPPAANTAIPLASPYQSMTPAAAAAALADMSKQMALDGGKQQQQHMAASQPL